MDQMSQQQIGEVANAVALAVNVAQEEGLIRLPREFESHAEIQKAVKRVITALVVALAD